jgi:glutamyl-tRNA(Gln) amidotransferase subunit E
MKKEIERQMELVKNGKSVAEVRNVLPNGTSEFLRPMPGAARMYPETDLPILKISRDIINEAKKKLPKLRTETEKDFKKFGLGEEMIKLLFKYNKMEEFREMISIFNNSQLVAKILLVYPKEIASKNNLKIEYVDERLNKDVISGILEDIKKNRVKESEIKNLMNRIVLGEEISGISSEKADADELMSEIEDKIRKTIEKIPGLSEHAYMGIIMKEFGGKVSGKEVMEIIKRYVK